MKRIVETLVFRAKTIKPPPQIRGTLELWTPAINKLVPPGKPAKYILFSAFHLLGIFGNSQYRFVRYIVDGKAVSSMLAVPPYFRYPFMGQEDVQYVYVMTPRPFQGCGYAWEMIYTHANRVIGNKWYVTTDDNVPSQKLAAKMGFDLVGVGERKSRYNRAITIRK